jgi:hypothetical protein
MAGAPFARAAPVLPPALFGIALNTSLDAAQNSLPTYKVKTDPSDRTKTQMIGGPAELFGESFTVNFTFDAAGKLDAIYAIGRTPKGDFGICLQHWSPIADGIVKEFGPAKTNKVDLDAPLPSQSIAYIFPAGETLEASLLGCLIMVSYRKAP